MSACTLDFDARPQRGACMHAHTVGWGQGGPPPGTLACRLGPWPAAWTSHFAFARAPMHTAMTMMMPMPNASYPAVLQRIEHAMKHIDYCVALSDPLSGAGAPSCACFIDWGCPRVPPPRCWWPSCVYVRHANPALISPEQPCCAAAAATPPPPPPPAYAGLGPGAPSTQWQGQLQWQFIAEKARGMVLDRKSVV